MTSSNASGSPGPDSAPKPEEPNVPKVINIKVKDQQEHETFFKVKPTTKLGKVFRAYCDRQSIDIHYIRFLLHGTRVQEDETPEKLEMVDGDEIQAMIEQQGGDGSPAPDAPPPEQDGPKGLNVKVVDQAQNEVFFKIKFSTPLKKVMDAYCGRQGIMRDAVRFLVDGVRINDGDTPASKEMEDGDTIEVFTQQLGGNRDGSEVGAEGGEGSTSANGEDKSKQEGAKNHITINVKYNNGGETGFKVKPTTPMMKLMDAYCSQLGRAPGSLRFFTPDGKRVQKIDTPQSLELEDGDLLDAHEEQQGGAAHGQVNETAQPTEDDPADLISFRVKNCQDHDVWFKMKRTMPFKKLMNVYCTHVGEARNRVNFFTVDGSRITVNDTPKSLKLKDGGFVRSSYPDYRQLLNDFDSALVISPP
ncbi:hypothetical protein EG329_002916 [Mollisiaceae sp. DMI_Dod_QoI]|nr:hypothetical protein EG329_002916 [Helotiales sp. DMI_Dod_QoI]